MLPLPRRAAALILLALLAGACVPPTAAQAPLPGVDDGSALPDLIGSNLDHTPREPHVAEDIRFCADVRNIGDADVVTRFDVTFLLDNAEEGAVRVTDTLRAGHALTVCHTFTFPPTSAGDHQWTVRVDSSGEVMESDERNNEPTPRSLRLLDEARPDLVIVVIGVQPRVSRYREPQIFFATVQNVGDRRSAATSIDFHLDINDERTVVRLPLEALEPGQRTEKPVHSTVPDRRQAGLYTAEFIVDPEDNVTERRENNNRWFYDYEVSQHPAPDFVLSDANLTGEMRENRSLRLDLRVLNRGDLAGETTVVRLYAENETGVNRTLGNATVSRLGIGSGTNVSFLFTLGGGNFTLHAVVDPDQRLAERDKTNNGWGIRVEIEPAPAVVHLPNLRVESLDATPDDPRPGEVVTILALVSNDGEAAASNVVVRFWVGDEQLSTVSAKRIEPGKPMPVDIQWPARTFGEHTLRVEVDPESAIEEHTREDNALVTVVTLRDPTAPTSPTPPPSGEDGNGDGGNDGGDGSGGTPTTPTPGTPTPPTTPTTPTTPPPGGGNSTRPTEPPLITQLDLVTTPQPGKVIGKVTVQVRNPNLEALPAMTLAFLVDGQRVKEVLVSGVGPAGVRSITSGDIELPPGEHTLSAEIRFTNSLTVVARSEQTYDADADALGLPAPGALALLAVLGAGALVARRKRED